jgi:hypothetical protein
MRGDRRITAGCERAPRLGALIRAAPVIAAPVIAATRRPPGERCALIDSALTRSRGKVGEVAGAFLRRGARGVDGRLQPAGPQGAIWQAGSFSIAARLISAKAQFGDAVAFGERKVEEGLRRGRVRVAGRRRSSPRRRRGRASAICFQAKRRSSSREASAECARTKTEATGAEGHGLP